MRRKYWNLICVSLTLLLISSTLPLNNLSSNNKEQLNNVNSINLHPVKFYSYDSPDISFSSIYNSYYRAFIFGGAGAFTHYPLRVTTVGDFFRLDYPQEFEVAKAKTYELHSIGLKIILYTAGISSVSERKNLIDKWNLSAKDIAPMDLNRTYFVDPPYMIGYEGRRAWQDFYISFLKYLFDAGFDGIEIDGGDGLRWIGSFDPETMNKFNQFLASKYNSTELKEKFNITDINSFNFTEYLRNLGYHHNSVWIDNMTIAHPGPDGPKGDIYAEALWKEFLEFNLRTLLNFYKAIWENVTIWETETGREFYISTKVTFDNVLVTPYVDAIHWEYTWPNYPNRTASSLFKIFEGLNKTFNLWIAPYSSLESTGFSEWYTSGWNKSSDPELQYLGLAEIFLCGGRVPVSGGTNLTHFEQFIRLFQENPQIFWQKQYGDIALVYSVATSLHRQELGLSSYFEGSFDSYEGAYYLLADSHRSVDVIVFGDGYWVNITPSLNELLKYKAIVLSETLCMSDEQVALLEQYVQRGGIIIGFGDIATYNEFGEPVNRVFSTYFDGQIHQIGNGLIVSIRDISPSQYLVLRTFNHPLALQILQSFKNILDQYAPPEMWSDNLPYKAHIYRFLNEQENALIFGIINFNYNYTTDKVIREYNVDLNFKIPDNLKGKDLSVWIYSEENPSGMPIAYNISGDIVNVKIPKLSILTMIEVRPHFDYHESLIIDSPTSYSNIDFIIDRDIIIKSILFLDKTNIIVRGSVKPIKIEVLPGGALYILNSKITKESGTYYIVARKGSTIVVKNSEISGAGVYGLLDMGGLCIETESAVVINNVIHDNYDYGVLLYNAHHSIIGNNIIYNNKIGIVLVNTSYIELYNNTVKWNNLGICVETPDIYDAGVRLRALMKMWEKHKIPSRGATKITITDSKIYQNHYGNIVVIGSNFVTVKYSYIGETNGNNIFCWESAMIKIYNNTIKSAHNGIYLEECNVNTIINNILVNHSFAGIFIYKCVYQGIFYWNHLENPGGETRIVGNYIKNNSYGIYMDFGWGYFNAYMRIQKNEISYNKVGVYLNLTQGYIYQNNFIGNNKHALVGPGGGEGWWYGGGPFYVNISKINYGFQEDPIGNYWDDWDKVSIPYEVCPGYYDYFPIANPVPIPKIYDSKGPYIETYNYQRIWVNSTHYKIKFNYTVIDESWLGCSGFYDTMRFFGFHHFVGPYLRQLDPPYYELEFPWIGYPGYTAAELLGPEGLSKIFHGVFETGVINASWLKGAKLTLYVTDMWGNWNRNDTYPPHITLIADGFTVSLSDEASVIYVLVSDWSEITKVQLMYLQNSTWKTIDMNYDKTMHLYYLPITPSIKQYLTYYKIYAEDIYGNSNYIEVKTDLEGPTIKDVSYHPEKPTKNDPVKVSANITDPSGIDTAILMYTTDQITWHNITMTLNETTRLYEATIPAMPPGTKVYFKIYANDTLGNDNISQVYNYSVTKPSGTTVYLEVGAIVAAGAVILLIIYRKRRG